MLDTGYSGELMESLPIGTALPPSPVQHSVVQGVQGQQRETSVSREVTVQTLGAPARLQMSTYIGNHPNKTRYVLEAAFFVASLSTWTSLTTRPALWRWSRPDTSRPKKDQNQECPWNTRNGFERNTVRA